MKELLKRIHTLVIKTLSIKVISTMILFGTATFLLCKGYLSGEQWVYLSVFLITLLTGARELAKHLIERQK